MRKTSVTVISIIFLILTTAPLTHAGWVDDWLTQTTYSGPNAFEGQKRGYLSAGNLSARFPTSADYLMTVSPPRFKAGCGGIDMFMGGFSFLNMDYLGDKFQRIISSAPVLAFDLALKALSNQVADEMAKLESIVNALNNIQLDDCKAAQAVATIAVEGIQGNTATVKASVNQMQMDMGLNDLYKAADKDSRNDPRAALSNVKSQVTGGDSDLEKLLYMSGSLLAKAADKYGSAFNQTWIDLARGYTGDIVWLEDNDPLSVKEITPCAGNKKDEDYSDFTDGKAQANVDAGGLNFKCQDIADTNKSMYNYVYTMVSGITDKLKSKQSLTDEEQAFISKSPVPVFLHIKMAIAQKSDANFSELLSERLAYVYSIKQLKDLYETTYKMLEMYGKDIANTQADSSLKEGALKEIRKYQKNVASEIMRLNRAASIHSDAYMKAAEHYLEEQKVFADIVQNVLRRKEGF